jgi:DNA-binding FadR family transcriptional regulator
MSLQKNTSIYLSEFLLYLSGRVSDGEEQLPSLNKLSKELNISVATLREQLEVARVFGLVEVRPRTGIRWLPYRFAPSILGSVGYAIKVTPCFFEEFRDLRNHVESAYFYEAVTRLTREDIELMVDLVQLAINKIQQIPPQLPHNEHVKLHQILFSHIDNVFVQGILEGYWEIYEDRGLSIINDMDYLDRVWRYHGRIVDALRVGDNSMALNTFMEHKDIIKWNPKPNPNQKFE